MCKRPCFHNDYLPCFNLSNVTLINTAGKGVDRISETGIVANDQEYDLDCIIYATGFDFGTDYSSRAGYTIAGRNSLTLAEKWKDGPNTLCPGGIFLGSVRPVCPSAILFLAFAWLYLFLFCQLHRILAGMNCHSCISLEGYFTYEGAQSLKALRSAPYAAGATVFHNVFDTWMEANKLEGLEVDREVQLN
jgi:hypothetical protein